MAQLQVELVSADRRLWSGESTMVLARTVDGEIGILPGHTDHLSVLVDGGLVDIRQGEEAKVLAAVHGGFLLVHDNLVRILAETAELGDEVDVERAKASLARARSGADDEESRSAARRAEARLRAAGSL